MEIERKFTIKTLPENLEQYPCKVIEQGYLCTVPVVRIRKSNDDYILTYKSKFGIQPSDDGIIKVNEVEVPLNKEGYEHLKQKVDYQMVCKRRYLIPLDQYTIELDVFEGHLTGLCFAEVEFPNEEEAKAFQMPQWFLEDVSADNRYRNTYLSQVKGIDNL